MKKTFLAFVLCIAMVVSLADTAYAMEPYPDDGEMVQESVDLEEKDATVTYMRAPNMYIDYEDLGDYDTYDVDWYCEEDTENTYWAVHCWGSNFSDGYAGFQNLGGEHILLLSVWDYDDDSTGENLNPGISYYTDQAIDDFDFGGEGTGAHIKTVYPWVTGKWYSMRVKVWSDTEKSYIEQWVREDGGEWEKIAAIYFPRPGYLFSYDSMFQEDFGEYDVNGSRMCRIKGACGKNVETDEWDICNEYFVRNSYYNYYLDKNGEQQIVKGYPKYNVNVDCDYGMKDGYIWLKSGGNAVPDDSKSLPVTYKLYPSVTGISLDKKELTLKIGGTAQLTATIEPENAFQKEVEWSSGDDSVATVEDGLVTAIDEGTTTITVTTLDGNKEAECEVTVEADQVVPDDHTHDGVFQEEKAATCTESGYDSHYKCSICDVLFSDEACTVPVTLKSLTVPAKGHTTGSEWQIDDEKHWKVCSVCDATVDSGEHTGKPCSVCQYEEGAMYEVTISDGGVGAEGAGSYAAGEKVSIKAGTKEGYTFAGWYKDAEYKTEWDVDADVVTGKTTIYAKWKANTYSVRFDGNGSTGGSMEAMTVSYD